jgi:hypothetical protein
VAATGRRISIGVLTTDDAQPRMAARSESDGGPTRTSEMRRCWLSARDALTIWKSLTADASVTH